MSDFYEEFERLAFSTDNIGYFYRVEEFMTTFEKDQKQTKPLETKEDFKGNNLLQCRKDAVRYYIERLIGFQNSSYFLPFASPKDFKFGENAAYSLNLYLIDVCSDRENEIVLLGESLEENLEGQVEEAMIFKKLKDNKPKVEPLSYNRAEDTEEALVGFIRDMIKSENNWAFSHKEPPSESDLEFMTYVDKLIYLLDFSSNTISPYFKKYLQDKVKAFT